MHRPEGDREPTTGMVLCRPRVLKANGQGQDGAAVKQNAGIIRDFEMQQRVLELLRTTTKTAEQTGGREGGPSCGCPLEADRTARPLRGVSGSTVETAPPEHSLLCLPQTIKPTGNRAPCL